MRLTVVGSGNGGCAIAGVLASRGHDVSILKLGTTLHMENFLALQAPGTIRVSGIEVEGVFPLHAVTADPAEVLPRSEIVLIYYVSNYHEFVAQRCAEHMHAGQLVVLSPGYAGSLLFERRLRALGKASLPLFAEFDTLPYSSRIVAPGHVEIVSRNVCHPFAAYPASRAPEVASVMEPLIGRCVPRSHILEVALHNPNLVIHTVGVLMNAARVESPERRFAMYRDGFSPSIWNVVERLDAEKMRVMELLGSPATPYFDAFRLRTFGDISTDLMEGFSRYADEAPSGPFTLQTRYITEDVPMGLGLLSSLAKATGVAVPVCDSLIHLACALLPEHDFWSEARTLTSLWEGQLDDLLEALTS